MFALLPLFAAFVATIEPTPPPASEALIDRFMAVLPDAGRLDRVERTADPIELDRLAALNPGRIDDIRPVLEEYAGCNGAARNMSTRRIIRIVARALGEEKLARLTAFFGSADLAFLERLGRRDQASLSATERAEFERILAAYPLVEFEQAMNPYNPVFWENDEVFADEARCDQARDAALTRLGLAFGQEAETEPESED